MPRNSTEREVFGIKDPSIQTYFGGNGTATTEYMKKVKSELTNKEMSDVGDEKVLKWIDDTLNPIGKSEDAKKKIGMDTDAPGTKMGADGTNSNHFKEFKGKDDNANPTKVRMAKIKGSSREIMSNSATYESVDKEIGDMKYLIEYMNNKDKNNKL